LIDRELNLPEPWIADRDRYRAAEIPDEVEFVTKPARTDHVSTTGLGCRPASAGGQVADTGCSRAGRCTSRLRSPITSATDPAAQACTT
jgi:hypothetical protein